MRRNKNTLQMPILSWDIHSVFLREHASKHKLQFDSKALDAFHKKYNWAVNVSELLAKHPYEALVLTDSKQEIQWVNDGFNKMTGYPTNYAIGRRPNFLQGKETSLKNINSFRENLNKGIPFEETLTNYRKNGEIYICKITIHPLKDTNNIITHYLALENELKMTG